MNEDYTAAVKHFEQEIKMIIRGSPNEPSEKNAICEFHISNLLKLKKVKEVQAFMSEYADLLVDQEFVKQTQLSIAEE